MEPANITNLDKEMKEGEIFLSFYAEISFQSSTSFKYENLVLCNNKGFFKKFLHAHERYVSLKALWLFLF